MKKLIYYVEDDRTIAEGVRAYLEDRGFCVRTMETAQEAKAALGRRLPALLLMDVNLPDADGGRLCGWVRQNWENLPVIFLTVRTDTRDIVRGFQTGADDYVGKPFELEVLYSRICALLRRSGAQGEEQGRLSCGFIVLDTEKLRVFCQGEEIVLGAMEYQLLLSLMQNKNHTLLRSKLIDFRRR